LNKDEILKASRNENQNRDIYGIEIIRKGQRIGGLIGLIAAFTLMFTERIILENGTNYGYFLIIFSAAAGLFIYKAVKLKKKHEIMIASIYIIMAVYSAVMVVLGYIG